MQRRKSSRSLPLLKNAFKPGQKSLTKSGVLNDIQLKARHGPFYCNFCFKIGNKIFTNKLIPPQTLLIRSIAAHKTHMTHVPRRWLDLMRGDAKETNEGGAVTFPGFSVASDTYLLSFPVKPEALRPCS